MYGNTCFLKLPQDFGVIVAPDQYGVTFLVKVFYGVGIFCVAHEHAACKTDNVSVYPFRYCPFGDFCILQSMDKSVYELQLAPELTGLVVNAFCVTCDVHKAKFLELFQEVLLLSVQKNEGVFGHGSNHSSEASSSSAWRFLTILDDALLRFSSSSM